MNDEDSDEAAERCRDRVRITTNATEFGRPTPSAAAKVRGAAAMSEPHMASVGVRTYGKSNQVEDYTRWSNLKLEEDMYFCFDNHVFPLPLFERTCLISPMQHGILNETLTISTWEPSITVARGSGLEAGLQTFLVCFIITRRGSTSPRSSGDKYCFESMKGWKVRTLL